MTSTATQSLSRATGGQPLGGLPGTSATGPLADASRKLVSTSFFGTLLKQMREDPFKSDLFDGGRGGQSFNALLDEHLAEHLGRGAGNKLINSFVRRYQKLMPQKRDSKPAPRRSLSTQHSALSTRKKGGGRVPTDLRA